MLRTWRYKRDVKRKQAMCKHDWRYVGRNRWSDYDEYGTFYYSNHHVYCPICDAHKTYENEHEAMLVVEMAKLRREALG